MLGFNRSTYYYRSRANPQTELRIRLKELAAARVRYGSRQLHILLVQEGWKINHKRVYHLYKEEGLNLWLKTSRKRVCAPRVPMPQPSRPDEVWSMDFMADRLADGANAIFDDQRSGRPPIFSLDRARRD